jgi:hypothetical protein
MYSNNKFSFHLEIGYAKWLSYITIIESSSLATSELWVVVIYKRIPKLLSCISCAMVVESSNAESQNDSESEGSTRIFDFSTGRVIDEPVQLTREDGLHSCSWKTELWLI